MILCIDQGLTDEEVALIVTQLEQAEFVDGKLTAGWHAKQVKHNTQLKNDAKPLQELQAIVTTALKRNRLFQTAVRPKTIRPCLFSRYEVGMYYGDHVDNALMGDGALMRSDVSVTVFLSDPTTYEGGELVIDTATGEQSFKLAAGDIVAYPSTTLHRVEPISAGERYAAVTWVQSLIRNVDEREILFELDTARQVLFEKHGKTPEFDLICKSYANLLRKWVEL